MAFRSKRYKWLSTNSLIRDSKINLMVYIKNEITIIGYKRNNVLISCNSLELIFHYCDQEIKIIGIYRSLNELLKSLKKESIRTAFEKLD